MIKRYLLAMLCCSLPLLAGCKNARAQEKPRILISSDIGGTDPDDNQSMAHLFMYSDLFDLEGLVSSASFGNGSKEEILRMIDVYEKDYPILKKTYGQLASPEELRALCKQGKKGLASFAGFDSPTEGSDWIIRCARKKSGSPLYVLVWGTLEDVAQALHDAPDIADKIRVYWIGGPNKKWGVNSYCYIAKNFPELWMIENNASYRGFISDKNKDDDYNSNYYDKHIKGAGHLGADFKAYYDGLVKMGDTPSLLYMMDGDPSDPEGDSWGGSFEKITESPYTLFTRNTSVKDTIAVYSVLEWQFEGPVLDDSHIGETYFKFTADRQDWNGVYVGGGKYAVRYSPKQPAVLEYTTQSDLKELDGHKGAFVVSGLWPGKKTPDGFPLGDNWYSDKSNPELFDGVWQGSLTVGKHRVEVLDDWIERWNLLKKII